MTNLITIVRREFRVFFSDSAMTSLYIGGPLLYGLLFGLSFSQGKLEELNIVVVDHDISSLSSRYTEMLDEHNSLDVSSTIYDNSSAEPLLLGSANAVVVIPSRFEGAVLSGKTPEVCVYLDGTNLLLTPYLSRAILTVSATLNAGIKINTIKRKGITEENALQRYEGIKINTFRLFNTSSNYSYFILPSYFSIILQSVVMIVVAMSFAREYEKGKLPSIPEGTSLYAMGIGKLLPHWVISLFAIGTFFIYSVAFKLPHLGNLWGIFLITLIFILSSSLLGMCAGILIKSQLKTLQLLVMVSMPTYISSGFSWPLDHFGLFAKLYAYTLPFMSFVNALRQLIVEQGSIKEIADLLCIQLVQLLCYSIIGVVLLSVLMRRKLKVKYTR